MSIGNHYAELGNTLRRSRKTAASFQLLTNALHDQHQTLRFYFIKTKRECLVLVVKRVCEELEGRGNFATPSQKVFNDVGRTSKKIDNRNTKLLLNVANVQGD